MANRLLRSAGLVSSLTGLSRIFGFVRDMIVAHFFGATFGVDAFLVANKIPNFMRRLFAEGAFSQAFVPVLSEYRKLRSVEEVKSFVNHIAGMLATVLLGVSVAGIMLSPILVMIFAPGFLHDHARLDLASVMLKITFPYLFLVSLTALSGAILNSYDRFGIPAFTPVLLNISIILSAIYLAPHLDNPIYALAWGVFVGGITQLLLQYPFLRKIGLMPTFQVNWKDEGVKKVLKLMVPALFGVSVAQVNLMIDTWFASFLKVGSVSWLYYSDRLTGLPLGVFGVAIATVSLPTLSRSYAAKSFENYNKTLDWALRMILLIGIPASLSLCLLAVPLLGTLLHYGAFTSHDVVMASQSLMAFALGVPAFMLVKILASAYYARQEIKTPVRIAVVAMGVNTVLSLSLIGSLQHAGLALATTLAGYVNAGLLYRKLRQKSIYQPEAGWKRFLGVLVFANTALWAFIYCLKADLSVWLEAPWFMRAGHLVILVFGGMVLYMGALLVMGVRVRHFKLRVES